MGLPKVNVPTAYIDIVDGIVRSSLEFKGYALVLPEQLNAQNLNRQATTDKSLVTTTEDSRSERRGLILQRETVDTSSTTTTAAKSSHVVITGSTFADLHRRSRFGDATSRCRQHCGHAHCRRRDEWRLDAKSKRRSHGATFCRRRQHGSVGRALHGAIGILAQPPPRSRVPPAARCRHCRLNRNSTTAAVGGRRHAGLRGVALLIAAGYVLTH